MLTQLSSGHQAYPERGEVMGKNARRIAIITDSTSDIAPESREKYQITVVPLYMVWGMEELRDGIDIDNATFYARLQRDPIHPKTSQPTPNDFVKAIEQADAEEVVIIAISSQLSGTYDSACTARDMVDVPVHIFDTRSVSLGLGFQVLAAARVRDEGGDAQAMLAAADRVRQGLSVLFTVDTLDYLHKGGRIGGAAKLMGSALQLKPMLAIDNVTGRIDAAERIRTRQKALRRLVEATFERVDPGRPMRVGVLHAAAPDEAQSLVDEIQSTYHPLELITSEITPVLGVHGGPGLVGVGAYNE
jgi:DegV family protein with EDD domain